jgi:hypothetical protein
VWQNNRSGLVFASGRSQLLTSMASVMRPSLPRGIRLASNTIAEPADVRP